MKKSSAALLEPRLAPTTSAFPGDFSSTTEADSLSGSPDATSRAAEALALLRAPNFGELGSIYAIAARRAGRLNATEITRTSGAAGQEIFTVNNETGG